MNHLLRQLNKRSSGSGVSLLWKVNLTFFCCCILQNLITRLYLMLDFQLIEFFFTISLISGQGAFTIDTLSHLWEVLFVSSYVRLIKADTNRGLFPTRHWFSRESQQHRTFATSAGVWYFKFVSRGRTPWVSRVQFVWLEVGSYWFKSSQFHCFKQIQVCLKQP